MVTTFDVEWFEALSAAIKYQTISGVAKSFAMQTFGSQLYKIRRYLAAPWHSYE